VGAIVHAFTYPRIAYEVEFCDSDGKTVAQLLVTVDQIMPHSPGRAFRAPAVPIHRPLFACLHGNCYAAG